MSTIINPQIGHLITIGGKLYLKLVKNGIIKLTEVIPIDTASKPKKKRIIWLITPRPTIPGFTTLINHRGAVIRYCPNFIKTPKKLFR